jgi:hypothetical protein
VHTICKIVRVQNVLALGSHVKGIIP